jgi:hypothetical protein
VTTLTNDALLEQLCETYGIGAGEEIYLFAGAPTTQAGGGAVKGQLHRIVVNNVANAALVMKSILSNDAPSFVWILNDGAQSVNVFPFTGGTDNAEKMNGVANASQAVAAGQAALFMSIPVQIKKKGGTSGGGTFDWRAAILN